ncbi:PREDICTED: uncharacterized protein LOC109159598 isoform X3 [Ipomoea nil]|uniref:uncharacterized protein LOC109159598 isoform X3 n=1 Tax=Ipomoea nil TaxID=35883 RepID=UPI000901107C|nr:PREDICTED: uncharacterized protein LOC109159598 isoform X3 [Ipomoea nil]
MQCSKETIARLFYNVSSSFQLFLLFSYLTSIFLAKIFHLLGANIFFQRNQATYEFAAFSDEETEDENVYDNNYHVGSSREKHHFASNIIQDDQHHATFNVEAEEEEEDIESVDDDDNEEPSNYSSPAMESNIPSNEEVVEEKIPIGNNYFNSHENSNSLGPTLSSPGRNSKRNVLDMSHEDDQTHHQENISKEMMEREKRVVEASFMQEEAAKLLESKNKNNNNNNRLLQIEEKREENDEIFGDSFTVGSTSKSSSEWRSSIKDSCTDDPFSSSSRRSCPKWESYTLFQKYDEEMLFLDRISAQKLHETESLRSIKSNPRSISDRIVYKLAPKKQRTLNFQHNPYNELEGAYVAQICLTWEALNWNYKYFQWLRASNSDHGCPAYIAQQFQQFQVHLQRYIETEPYEYGRRPEVYARIRARTAPNLLQVPQYRDSDEEKREEGFCSRIPSDSFLQIMEEAIRTFMNFLKADKESHCQIIASFFKKNTRGSADPTLLLLLKRENKRKKSKLKDMRKSGGKCLRKRRLKGEEELEILMAEIDLKVVSRVLRMKEQNGEQLHWCEDKMGKVKISDNGKLHRDSSPLFFPAH